MPRRNPYSPLSDSSLLDSWGRANNRELYDVLCATCGRWFRPWRKSSRYCSRPCMCKQNGKNQPTKPEGWWIDAKGYIQGFVRKDGKKIRVKQHRRLMELFLGRPLLPTEDVHHINGNKRDNRLSNLQVMDHGAHTTLTNRERWARNHQ